MRWRVQLGLIVRVMFANFAKIGRAAGASKRKQTSEFALSNVNKREKMFEQLPAACWATLHVGDI